MTALETLTNWLQQFPLWDGPVYVDCSDGVANTASIYPQGLTEVSRQQDVAGNVRSVNRLSVILYRLTLDGFAGLDNAQWLLELQQWIRQQSAEGLAPVFGDVPQEERIWTEKGRFSRIQYDGTACYAVNLTAEFIKLY